mmetsp:Transcript_84413/g.243675  ORF Transcript_84413/g.243675 Transcript_84413/m.243675 type:complete len:251 (+) Transcript_84413:72-824(+)
MGATCCTSCKQRLNVPCGFIQEVPVYMDELARNSHRLPLAAKTEVVDKSDEYLTRAQLVDLISTEVEVGDAKKVMINVDLIETILNDGEESASSTPRMRPRRSVERRPTGYVTRSQVTAAAHSVAFGECEGGGGDDGAESVKRAEKKRPTGMVTKEQMMQALSNAETEDGEVEDDDERENRDEGEDMEESEPAMGKVASQKESTFILESQSEALTASLPPPRRRRSSVSFVTKAKLRRVLTLLSRRGSRA